MKRKRSVCHCKGEEEEKQETGEIHADNFMDDVQS